MLHIQRARILGALPALFLCALSVHAAQTPYVASVVQAQAEVRCKPGTDPKLYPTNRLPQGARVLVLEERGDGWLGIQPPHGSFSWVNSTQIERIVPTQENWVVKSDSVPVLIGGDVLNVRPTVEGVRLARGTQVRVMGKEVRDGDVVLFPIDPPAGEIRYIRAEAVRAELVQPAPTPATPVVRATDQPKATSTFVAVRKDVKEAPSLSIPSANPTNVPSLPANASPWQKAENYERLNRWDDAIWVYDQLGRDLQANNPAWADFARKRAAYIRQGGRAPVNWSNSMLDVRSTSTFQPAVQPQPQPQPQPQVKLALPVDPNAPAGQPGPQPASWSAPQSNGQGVTQSGRLVRSGFLPSSNAPYRLETTDTRYMTYVTAGQGVNLESFIDRDVEVTGTRDYNGNLKGYYMVISSVRPRTQ